MTLVIEARARRGDFVLDVAFESQGDVVAIKGESGAGKTTLLNALAGLNPADQARLIVNDVALVDHGNGIRPPTRQRRIGYVFQDVRLFPNMTVADNIAYGRRFAARPRSAAFVMDVLDLGDLASRWPSGLSGGEARRVAIARVLCADPALLFLDEPFSGLDERRRDLLIPYLVRLNEELGLPMLLVSHDPRDFKGLATEILSLKRGRKTPP